MRLCSIASGSSGNCIYAGDEKNSILLDAGISAKRIEMALKELDRKPQEIDGIFISHEHSDHIKGLGVLSRKHHIPIYATAGSIREIKKMTSLGEIEESLFHEVKADEEVKVGDMRILPFAISHDAAQPVGYRVESGQGSKAAVATDLGVYDEKTVEYLKGLDVLLLEANHDVHMLEVGSYPYPLKQRILGDKGHLSNESAGKLLCQVLHDDMKAVFLGHLSKENNYAELAYETVRLEIQYGSEKYGPDDFPIEVAKRDEISRMVTF